MTVNRPRARISPQRQRASADLDVHHLDADRRRPFVDHCRLHCDREFPGSSGSLSLTVKPAH